MVRAAGNPPRRPPDAARRRRPTRDGSALRKIETDANPDFDTMRKSTPARLGLGRAGPRYTTAAMLSLRADHARAVDAVMTEVARHWPRRNGLLKQIFIRNARVRIEDHLGEILRPDVVCMIVGERPGLVTAESLSTYVIYRPTLKSIEPDRTVISNIHRGGIPIAEAARKIATLIDDAIKFQASGVALAGKTSPPT